MTIDIHTATKADLVAYAREELGLGVNTNMSKDEVRQLVAKQLGQEVSIEAAQPDAPPRITANQREINKQGRVRIMIHENENYPARIPVCVNGVTYTIKPGVEVEVPAPVVEVLRNAIQTHIKQVEEGGRLRRVGMNAPQFAFSVLG